MTATAEPESFTHIGADYKGLTNLELALGKGTFVSDLELPGMTWASILRSPHAHARIVSIDTSAAEALDGVVYVMTGEEARSAMRPIPEAWNTKEIGAKGVKWYPLTPGRVRYVGEAVAAVVAEDKYTATRARDLIEVEYEVLPAVTDPEKAMEPGTDLVEPDWGDNLLITRDWRAGDAEAALAAAERRTSGYVRSERITGVPLEGRGVIASWDRFARKLTYWESTQNPHPLRTFLAETVGIPENDIRVVQPRVGGAFGLKQPPFQEEPLLAYLSMQLGRPVKWIEERDENFQATGHSRDVRFYYDVGFNGDGIVSSVDIRVIADVGAPTALLGWGQSFVTGYCLPACYKIPDARIQLSVVVTNKCPWNAYRGFGKDSASFVMDRIMDKVAHETGVDRAEVRLRNFIPPDEFPYPQPTGAVLDSGNYAGTMRKVLEMVDYSGFPALQEAARREGRRIGIGIGQELTPEGCAMPGAVMISAYDGATVRVAPTGEVTVLTGVTSPGCGNETAMAQIAAEFLGCEISRVRVIQGTPRPAHTGWATTAPAPPCTAARRPRRQPSSCARSCSASPAGCWRPTRRTSTPATAASSSRARRARRSRSTRSSTRSTASRSASSPRTRSPAWSPPGTSGWATSTTSRRGRAGSATTRPGPTAPRWRSSRSTRRPGMSGSCATAWSTTPAG